MGMETYYVHKTVAIPLVDGQALFLFSGLPLIPFFDFTTLETVIYYSDIPWIGMTAIAEESHPVPFRTRQ